MNWRNAASALTALWLMGAAPPSKGHYVWIVTPKNIVVAVDKDSNVTITDDGKPISCKRLNELYWKRGYSKLKQSLDCKMFRTKLDR